VVYRYRVVLGDGITITDRASLVRHTANAVPPSRAHPRIAS